MARVTDELRDHISDFEDVWRPFRTYFYWEKHCSDIPICWSIRSIFDTLDGVDEITDQFHVLLGDLDKIDVLMPQLLTQFPEMIEIMQTMRTMLLTMHSTMTGVFSEMERSEHGYVSHGGGLSTSPKTTTPSTCLRSFSKKQRLPACHESLLVAGRKGRHVWSFRRTAIPRRLTVCRGSMR